MLHVRNYGPLTSIGFSAFLATFTHLIGFVFFHLMELVKDEENKLGLRSGLIGQFNCSTKVGQQHRLQNIWQFEKEKSQKTQKQLDIIIPHNQIEASTGTY